MIIFTILGIVFLILLFIMIIIYVFSFIKYKKEYRKHEKTYSSVEGEFFFSIINLGWKFKIGKSETLSFDETYENQIIKINSE